jgi:hypothetical protein
MDLGMARQIDEHSREPAGVEIHRDRISISRFLDRGAVGQYVNAGKTEDLDARLDPVRLPRGGLGSTSKKDRDCENRPQEHKTSRAHRLNSTQWCRRLFKRFSLAQRLAMCGSKGATLISALRFFRPRERRDRMVPTGTLHAEATS